MSEFTVVLIRPKWLSDMSYECDSYVAFVDAEDGRKAADVAREEAYHADKSDGNFADVYVRGHRFRPTVYAVAGVFSGHCPVAAYAMDFTHEA